jgi:type VI secretion system protein ImpA
VILDAEHLSLPVADDAPCGLDLRGETEFAEIEESATRLAEYKTPEYEALISKCAALLERSKDQMPALVAAQAAARLGHPEAIDAALRVLLGMVAGHWDDYHPGPASEMAIARASEFAVLSRPAALVLPLGRMAIARMPGPGGAELNAATVEAACNPVAEWSEDDERRVGERTASGQMSTHAARDMRRVHDGARALRGLMRAVAPGAIAADNEAGVAYEVPEDAQRAREGAAQVLAAVTDSRARLAALLDTMLALTAAYSARAGEAPGLAQAQSQVGAMIANVDRFTHTFAPQAPASPSPDIAPPDRARIESAPTLASGEISRREDVVSALDRICRYYAAIEPGSPIPLVLQRARGWVHLDFISLMAEIAPSGLDEAKLVVMARVT